MIWVVFMGDLYSINPPVVPLFKGGQALGKSFVVPVWQLVPDEYYLWLRCIKIVS